jgi:hypothetical protein
MVMKDDFCAGNDTNFGELSWISGGGTVAGFAAEAGHPGIVRLDTTASSGAVVVYQPVLERHRVAGRQRVVRCHLRRPTERERR